VTEGSHGGTSLSYMEKRMKDIVATGHLKHKVKWRFGSWAVREVLWC
jgi:hypothetical protein